MSTAVLPARTVARPAPWGLVPPALFLLAAVPAVRGKLPLIDVAAVAALPLLLGVVWRSRRLTAVVVTAGLWAVGQLLADAVNGIGLRPTMQLVAAGALAAVTVALVHLAAGDARRVRVLVAAVALGLAAQEVVFPSQSHATVAHLWKFGLALPVGIAVLALADLRWHGGSRAATFVALPALAVTDLLADARSMAALTLFTLALYLVPPSRSARLRVATALATGLVLGVLLVGSFFAAARAGWLGVRSAEQLGRDSGDVVSVLTNARPELLQAYRLASQRPLTGYGSVPRLDSATFLDSLGFVTAQGVVVDENLRADWLAKPDPGVATHSMLLDSIVRAGLLAAPFWLYLSSTAVRRGVTAVRSRASPLVAFWSLAVLWDLLFSPLTGLYHVLLAAYLALVLLPFPGDPP
ncbi:MAG TPA: hypothetical protein VGD11_10110 [Mycobacteriales bacterium]